MSGALAAGPWWEGMFADTESWALLAGVLAPLPIALLQQPWWSDRTRATVGWLSAVLIGLLTCLAAGTLADSPTVLRSVAVVLVASQAVHAGWKKLGTTTSIEYASSAVLRTRKPINPQ